MFVYEFGWYQKIESVVGNVEAKQVCSNKVIQGFTKIVFFLFSIITPLDAYSVMHKQTDTQGHPVTLYKD